MYDSCLAARRSKLVGGMCSMLPYATGICCCAFKYCFYSLLLLSIPFLYIFLFKSGIDKSTEWTTIPACPIALCASFFFFFNRGNTEGTNRRKKSLMFVYVFCAFVSGLILLFWDNLWFDDLHAG